MFLCLVQRFIVNNHLSCTIIKFRFMKIFNKSDKIQENQTFLNLTLKKETCEGELEFDIENGNTLVSQVS